MKTATELAQKIADQELEACCEAMENIWDQDDFVTLSDFLRALRTSRRPKPLSLKKQALAKLPENTEAMAGFWRLTPGDVDTIRRALEQLDD